MKRPVFLTAEWRDVVLMNFVVDPTLLKPLLPLGTELDFFEGETFVSIVGFRFLDTRILGFPIPFHRNFEEVNLRYYVRRRVQNEWRRGVAFIRELVPKFAIAQVARRFYGEPYLTVPMAHRIESPDDGKTSYRYEWQSSGHAGFVRAEVRKPFRELVPGSREEFITEHYWGYTAHRNAASEFEVEHPRWRVSEAVEAELRSEVDALFGAQFSATLAQPPAFTFVAEGSAVTVRYRNLLRQ